MLIKGMSMDRRPHADRAPRPAQTEPTQTPPSPPVAEPEFVIAAPDLGGAVTELASATARQDLATFPEPEGIKQIVAPLESEDARLPGGWVLESNPGGISFRPGSSSAPTKRAGTIERELAPRTTLLLSYSVVTESDEEVAPGDPVAVDTGQSKQDEDATEPAPTPAGDGR